MASTIGTCFEAKHINKVDRDIELTSSSLQLLKWPVHIITLSRLSETLPHITLTLSPHPHTPHGQNSLKAPKWGSTKSMWQPFGKRVVHCDGCIRKQHVVPARCRGAALYFSHLLTTMSQCEMINLRWQTAVYPW